MADDNKNTPLYTQQTLLIKLKNQYDESSWERFVNYYKNYIFVVIKNLGITGSDAQDISQAILLKVWKKLPDFEYQPQKGNFRSWLNTIIRFHIYNLNRDQKKTQPFDTEKAIEAEIDSITEKEWIQHISQLAWEAIENSFSEQTKQVYVRLSQGESAENIAKDLDITRGTIYVYKERVQKALRKKIRHFDSELG